MQEIVLQIAENKRARCRAASGRLHDQIAERDRSGRRAPARSRWWRRAAPGWPARRSLHRPASRGAPTRRCRASRRRTTPAAIRAGPSRATRTARARTPRSRTPDGGRSPPRAATRSASQGREQTAERREVGRFEGGAHHALGHAEAVALRHGQRHRHGVGLSEIVHVQLVQHVDPLDRDAGGGDDGAGLLAGRAHPPFERRGVEAIEHEIERLHHVVPQVGQHAAERRGDARKARHQRALQPDLRGSAR